MLSSMAGVLRPTNTSVKMTIMTSLGQKFMTEEEMG